MNSNNALDAAAEFQRKLGLTYPPTPQQWAVIDAELNGIHLVLAGAGSGKTETMSMRALHLIARDGLEPHQIIGLTFTRKAANELTERFARSVNRMRTRKNEFVTADNDMSNIGDDPHGFLMPSVSTYNSFATDLFRDHGYRIGWDPDSIVITDATAYAIARDVVLDSTDPVLATLDKSIDELTQIVMKLSSDLVEYRPNSNEVESFVAQVLALNNLTSEKPKGAAQKTIAAVSRVNKISALPTFIALAQEFASRKHRRGMLEFSDQVAFARDIVERFPDVTAEYRNRYRAVILDEYQDTSVTQAQMLYTLFGNHNVTAVGDTNQSIYGWRGASASNVLDYFPNFGADKTRSDILRLTISWRNGTHILNAANTLVKDSFVDVETEKLVAGPSATTEPIHAVYANTVDDEADAVAHWFATQVKRTKKDAAAGTERPFTAALLLESRTHQNDFCAALRRHGVEYQILGVPGILTEPAIADLYSALAVIADPNAGIHLVRLLGGARWRVGVADLWALHNHARNLSSEYQTKDVREKFGTSLAADESESLVDALDSLLDRTRESLGGERKISVDISDGGYAALCDAAKFFRELRRLSRLPLNDIVRATTERLNLDIETAVNPSAESRSYFEAFDGLVASYRSIGLSDSLYGFVKWVADVQWLEKYSPRPEESKPGVVQVLTVHSAKGLEWDAVAFPRWTSTTAGVDTKRANELGWLNEGSLPHPFRPDAIYLPHLPIGNLATIEEAEKAIAGYSEDLKSTAYRAERRRVRYVGVTRAAHALMISGSFYNSSSAKPSLPDEWWTELEEAGLITPADPEICTETNPNLDDVAVASWPSNPFGSQRHEATVRAAAKLVAEADSGAESRHDDEIQRLLAESRIEQTAVVPVRIPASRYAEWSTNLDAVREGNRRPVPTKPFRAARVGNEVHLWIERGAPGEDAFDLVDVTDDEIEPDTKLDSIKQTYLASRWPKAHCLYKEIEILLPQGPHIIVCKIDAVYEIDGRLTIVDWKTGAKPRTESDKDAKAMQIVLYRRALSALTGTAPSEIDCYLFYLAHDWEWKIESNRLDRLDALPPID